MPGFGRTRFNKGVLETRIRKLSQPDTQEIVSPSAKNEGSASQRSGTEKEDFGIFQYPAIEREVPREIKLQEWEGQVQEVGNTYFSARLVDLTAGENEETEEAELPLDDLEAKAIGRFSCLVPYSAGSSAIGMCMGRRNGLLAS